MYDISDLLWIAYVCLHAWAQRVAEPNSKMCVCGGVPTPVCNSQTPAECPSFQLNSDIIYLQIESDSTSKGLSPTRRPSISDSRCKPGLLPVLLTH